MQITTHYGASVTLQERLFDENRPEENSEHRFNADNHDSAVTAD